MQHKLITSLLVLLIAFGVSVSSVEAISILPEQQGGTGIGYPNIFKLGALIFGGDNVQLATSTDLIFATTTSTLTTKNLIITGTCTGCGGISSPVSIANGGTATSTGGVTNGVEYYNGTTLTNRSTLIFTGSNVGIGSTTPFSALSVSTTTASAPTTSLFAVASSTNATLFNVLGSGNVGLGTTTPGTLLSLGNTGANTINLSATATSTFGSGINIVTGCFAINGTCLTGGGVTSMAQTYGTAQTGAITLATSSDSFNGLQANETITNGGGPSPSRII